MPRRALSNPNTKENQPMSTTTTAERIAILRVLENAGYQMPAPDTLNDTQVDVKLGEALSKAATYGVYVTHTDHLTSRQVYEYLFTDGFREEAVLFPENPNHAHMIDLLGKARDEDMQAYFRYYADEADRADWDLDPDETMPSKEKPPYDRDRLLPTLEGSAQSDHMM